MHFIRPNRPGDAAVGAAAFARGGGLVAFRSERQEKGLIMRFIRCVMVLGFALALAVGGGRLVAGQSCCVKSKVQGKDCAHPCCVEARKAGKTCEKCQKEPSCCDKAIAQGKACAHPCCAEAAKQKKICEKCNPAKDDKK
jgi:hypothetical protein